MTTPFPATIDFSLIKPKGYSAQLVNREFTPSPFNANIAQQDIIRFVINQHRGFWDPYTAYLDVDIDFTGMSATGCQQLDGSAHSLISRLQVYVNGTSLELIDEYDTLLHFLQDMQVSKENKKLRLNEGVGTDDGGMSLSSQSFETSTRTSANLTFTGPQVLGGASHLFLTQRPNQWLLDASKNFTNTNLSYNMVDKLGTVGNYALTAPVLSSVEPYYWITNFPVALQDIFVDVANAQHIPLQRYEEQLFANKFTYSPTNIVATAVKNTPGAAMSGFFAGNFCNANFEAVFSTNYTQYHVKNGNIGAQSVIPVGSFQFPLASSLLGTLLPSESYKYIPFSALPDLVIEFTLNKYAFFTSGYVEDVNSAVIAAFTDCASQKVPLTQQPRYWKILKFNLNVDIVLFDDPAIEDMINAQLVTNGILLHTCGWTLALKQVLQTTAQCAGNFQINYGFESLKALFLLYELNDYQQYTFCRKHFRCSRNVTSLQIRIGDKLYPQTPIVGHGGNALKYNQNALTNYQFVMDLYRAFNKQFAINSEAAVNMANFAPNKRSYNVTPYTGAPITAFFSAAPAWVYNPDTTQTTMGQSLMFENQLRGMAAYAVAMDVMGADLNVMGGVDTKQNIPFNVLVTTDTTDTGNFPSNIVVDLPQENPVTAQFWCYYDVLYLFKAGSMPQKIGAQ